MAEFLNRPLGELDQLFNFRGNQVRTQSVDLSGITLVHNVADGARQERSESLTRQVALTQGNDGSMNRFELASATTTASVWRAEQDPWAACETAGLDLNEIDVYLTDVAFAAATSAGSLVEAALVIARESQRAAAPYALTPLMHADGLTANGVQNLLESKLLTDGGQLARPADGFPYKINRVLGVGSDLVAVMAEPSGTVQFFLSCQYYVTPRNIAPSWITGR